jgi:hypothetical protein
MRMVFGSAHTEYFKMIIDWQWKRWDVRSDGKVFWKRYKNRMTDLWVDWDWAIKEQDKRRIAANKRAIKKRDDIKAYQKEYRKNNKEKIAFHKYSHYSKHKKAYKSRVCAWISKNKEKYLNRMRKYSRTKSETDQMYVMRKRMRSRVSSALSEFGYTKKSKTYEMLGCDWHEFTAYIEASFYDGMNWENRKLWHVDHIIPLASAKNEEQLIALFHYKNTRPLWAFDNLSKGCKLPS